MKVLLLKIPESAIARQSDDQQSQLTKDYFFVDRLTQGFLRRGRSHQFLPRDQLIWMRSLARPFDQVLLFCGTDWPAKESLKWLDDLGPCQVWLSGSFEASELKVLQKKIVNLVQLPLSSFDLNQEPLCEL
jgi:hypothetical protein